MKFLFLDDSGNRKDPKKDRYFCLGGFCIDAENVHRLKPVLDALKERWRLHPSWDEVKFSNIGRDRHSRKKPNPLVREGYELQARIQFGFETLAALTSVPSVRCIGVGIDKLNVYGRSAVEHAVELVGERFQMELQKADCHGVIVCDEEQRHHEQFRQSIYRGSSYVLMENVAETVMFVPSQHSAGVQFADMVVGSMARFWNHRDPKYAQALVPYMRTYYGRWQGAGMKSFPGAGDYPPAA